MTFFPAQARSRSSAQGSSIQATAIVNDLSLCSCGFRFISNEGRTWICHDWDAPAREKLTAERGHQAIRSSSFSLPQNPTRVVTKMQTFAASGSRGTLDRYFGCQLLGGGEMGGF